MRRALVAGNWKMNGSLEGARALVAGIADGLAPGAAAEVVVCPPFVYLGAVAEQVRGTAIALGAQNLCERGPGAFTGEVAAEMLADVGCRYVLVGHSERRAVYGETDDRVAAKFARALELDLTPVLCLGEVLEEREGGATEQVVARQLDAVITGSGIDAIGRGVIAYEPVWAIGTGRTATPEQAQEVHAFIRGRLRAQRAGVADSVRILYGGSVKADNAASLLAMPDVDGGLVGGASLDAGEFLGICGAV
jgi:triosephosphate isomerase